MGTSSAVSRARSRLVASSVDAKVFADDRLSFVASVWTERLRRGRGETIRLSKRLNSAGSSSERARRAVSDTAGGEKCG